MPQESIRVWRVEVTPVGAVLQEAYPNRARISLDSAQAQLPDGAYTTLRTFERYKTLPLEAHFERLEQTAQLAGQPLKLERKLLRQALRLAVVAYLPGRELRLRLFIDLQEQPGTAYILCEELRTPPAQAYEEGVKVITCDYVRLNPKAKLTRTMVGAQNLRQTFPGDVDEALMVDEAGHILEGLSSNFFAVLNGEVWTAEEGVLSGITRQLVLDEIHQAGIVLHLASFPLTKADQLQEAFITSASRGVLPVRQINDWVVGSGLPGAITRQLAKRYAQRISLDIEEI